MDPGVPDHDPRAAALVAAGAQRFFWDVFAHRVWVDSATMCLSHNCDVCKSDLRYVEITLAK